MEIKKPHLRVIHEPKNNKELKKSFSEEEREKAMGTFVKTH